jgi:hypothetical protein
MPDTFATSSRFFTFTVTIRWQYDFYTSNGDGGQLDFVQDYWQQFEAKQGNVSMSATACR